jgi:hypothetical protein
MLVVVAMTTALCADQIVVAAPSAQPRPVEIAQMAQRLVSRLSENLRNTVPAATLCQARSEVRQANPASPAIAWETPASVQHIPASPFQFRLPPPLA